MMRRLLIGIATFAAAGAAFGQFDGPAPLAWRWLYPTTVAPSGSPLVSGDNVFTAVGGRVFSVDRETGNLKWRYPQLDPIAGTFRSAPILLGDTLLAFGDNKIVYAIDAATGKPKWNLNMPGTPIGQAIAVDGNIAVIAQSNNTLFAVDVAKAEPFWTAPVAVEGGIVGGIAASQGNVLCFTNNQKLVSVSVSTQKPVWSRQFESINSSSSPIATADSIYVASSTFLVAVNPGSGTVKWQVNTQMQLAFSPSVSNSGILVTSADGNVKVYDFDRQLITKQPILLGAGPVVNPSAAGNLFVVPTSNGAINLIDPATSSLIWSYIIRPLGVPTTQPASGRGGFGGPGGPGAGGGFGGPGGAGGAGGGGGFGGGGGLGGGGLGGGGGQGGAGLGGGGGLGGGQNGVAALPPVFVTASGPAVLSGTELLVPAKDGSILSFDRNLGVDLTPPRVSMLFPNPGDQVSGQPPLYLHFKLEDEASGLNEKTLKITVDGRNLKYEKLRDGTYVVKFSTSGENRVLPDGRHVFAVIGSDWLGNEVRQEYTLTIDNSIPPIKLPGATTQPGGAGGKGGFGGGGGAGGGGDDGGR